MLFPWLNKSRQEVYTMMKDKEGKERKVSWFVKLFGWKESEKKDWRKENNIFMKWQIFSNGQKYTYKMHHRPHLRNILEHSIKS